MSTKKNSVPQQDLSNVGEILSKSEKFIDKYQKQIIFGVAAIVLIVLSVLAVKHLYLAPKEKEAQAAIFAGERYLIENNWDLALDGDSLGYIGFKAVIDEYGFTQTANLANAYAGVCYYHKGNPEEALNYLNKFKADDKMVSPAIIGLIGNCYVDMGKVKEGIDYYQKAASKADDEMLSPKFLKKIGIAYESLGDYGKAADVYNDIRTKYPRSEEATYIEKYIDRAELLKKK